MTTTQAISIPIRYELQALTYEGAEGKVNSTRLLCMDRDSATPPREGDTIDLKDCPWEIEISDVCWDLAESRYVVSCETEIPEGTTASEVEAKLKNAGFREDVVAACFQEILDEHTGEEMPLVEIFRLCDERLELLGLKEEPRGVCKDGWQAVRILVHEDLPPLELDTLMPDVPDNSIGFMLSPFIGPTFQAVAVDVESVPGTAIVTLVTE